MIWIHMQTAKRKEFKKWFDIKMMQHIDNLCVYTGVIAWKLIEK